MGLNVLYSIYCAQCQDAGFSGGTNNNNGDEYWDQTIICRREVWSLSGGVYKGWNHIK